MSSPLQTGGPSTLDAAGPRSPIPDPGSKIGFLVGLVDRANPMLVRVVRQELRNRAFIAIFLLLLLGAAIAAMVVAAIITDHGGPEISRGLFATIAIGWGLALWLAQPMGCFRAIATERGDDTWDLVELTGLRPLRVVGGLLLASLVQGLLYTSALAPFMAMAYVLRGIDLMLVLFGLVVVPLGSVAASALAVFAACLGPNKASRAVLGSLLGLGLLGAWGASWAMWLDLSGLSSALGELRAGTTGAWIVAGAILNLWLGALVLLLVLSSSLLAFRAANRSTGPRLTWWLLWGNGWLWTVIVLCVADWKAWCTSQLIFACLGVGAAGVLGLFSTSEDVELSPRQARSITGARSRRRRLAMLLLGPGAARGRLSWLAMAGASLAIGIAGWFGLEPQERLGVPIHDLLPAAWTGVCWLAIIFTVADRLYRGWLADWFPTPGLRRGFILLLGSLWSLLMPLTLLIIWKMSDANLDGLKMFSPVQALFVVFDHDDGHNGIWSSLPSFIAFSIAGALALATQVIQGLRLGIVTQRILARDEDRNPRAA
jgi:hypothetical protein